MRNYRANFLYPHDDDSLEEAGYEFANGKSEGYIKNWWDILLERAGDLAMKNLSTAKLVEILSQREGVERVDIAPHKDKYEIAVCDENGKYRTGGIHSEVHTGPAVILVVTD